MKISLGSFSGKFKRFRLSNRGGGYHIGGNPNIDWALLLVVFFLVLIFIVGYAIFSMKISLEGLTVENLSVGVNKNKIFDENELKRVIDYYESRKVFLKAGTVPPITDPSL